MAPKAATLEIPELMQFLRQQLYNLPDNYLPKNDNLIQVIHLN